MDTSLVWVLGTRDQTLLSLFWQSLTRTCWHNLLLNAKHFYSLSQDMKEKQEAENEVKISRLDTENVEMEMKNVGEKTKRL